MNDLEARIKKLESDKVGYGWMFIFTMLPMIALSYVVSFSIGEYRNEIKALQKRLDAIELAPPLASPSQPTKGE